MKTTRSKKLWSALLALVMLLSLLPVSALADEVEGALPVESTTTLQPESDTTDDDEAEGGEPAPVNEASELSLDGGYGRGVTGVQTMQLGSFALTFTSGPPALGTYGYYYIDTDGWKIKMASDGKEKCDVTMNVNGSSVILHGTTNDEFTFGTQTIGGNTLITITVPNGAKITRGSNESITGVDNATVGFAANDVLWLVEGSGTIGGTGDANDKLQVKVSVSNTAYHLITVPATEKGDVTVQKAEAGTVVTLAKSGETFSVGEATYTAASNGAEFTIGADGSVTLTSGSASLADGDSIVGGGSGKTITNPVNSSNDTITVTVGEDKDTVTMSSTINGKVTIDSVEYTAAKETIIEVAKDGGNTLTSGSVGLAKDAGIQIGSLPITNKGENGGYVLVSVSSNGNTAFIPESGKVTIDENEIENPDDENSLMLGIDENAMLHVAARVTINGVTYTPLTDGSSSFPLNGGKLAKAGEKAAVPGGLANDVAMAIGGGDDAPVIVVSKTNKNVTTVDYVNDSFATVEFAKKGDSFTYTSNNKTITFTAGTDDALFTLDFEENNSIFITSGSATLTDGNAVLGGGSGQRIENPANSGNDEILVTAVMPEDGKDTVTVPAGGKVKINSTVYEAGRNGVTLVVDTEGEVSVTAGSLKSDDDSGNDGKTTATDTKPKGDKVAKTGDESNMALWVALALLATCATVTTTVVAKKKSYNR